MSAFNCVNCRLFFEEEREYKEHYKSQHHRYNVKRKLIGLTPLSHQDYLAQFDHDTSSKSSATKELHCELCSKKFLSPQTYKQHLNSQKHKNNRKKIVSKTNKISDENSETSSCSEFSVLGDKQKDKCLFCNETMSKQHLKQSHSFPPFEDECSDFEGLLDVVRTQIKSGKCLICDQVFQCEDSAKQHMTQVGHAQLNLNVFAPYEPFYLWKIHESEEEDFEQLNEGYEEEHYQEITKETLQSLQEKRMNRIVPTKVGYKVNGKQVGARAFKNYYKQYLDRNIPENPFRAQLALTNSEYLKENYSRKSQPLKPIKNINPQTSHR